MSRLQRTTLALAAGLLAASGAACGADAPLGIEPQDLAGAWAGSAAGVSVQLDCAERSSQTVGIDGRPGISYTLGCQGTFRDPARGVDTRVVGGGSPSAYSRGQKEDRFGFGVITSTRHTDGALIGYRYEGRATSRTTIVGSFVRETRRPSIVTPTGEVGGPEIVTPLDSIPLALQRQ